MYMSHSNTLWASNYIVVKKVVLRHCDIHPTPPNFYLYCTDPLLF